MHVSVAYTANFSAIVIHIIPIMESVVNMLQTFYLGKMDETTRNSIWAQEGQVRTSVEAWLHQAM
jgi:hypothetical protein